MKTFQTGSSGLQYLGYTLVEVLVSLLLSTFIMSILISQYLDCKRFYIKLEAQIEQALDIQMIIQGVQQSIRQAGFTPCLGLNKLMAIDYRQKPKGVLPLEIKDDGHSLLINRMSEYFETIVHLDNKQTLRLPHELDISVNQSVMIADCYHAEVQAIETVIHSSNNLVVILKKPLYYRYQAPIYFGEWIEERYLFTQTPKPTFWYQRRQKEILIQPAPNIIFKEKIPQGIIQTTLWQDKNQPIVLETKRRVP